MLDNTILEIGDEVVCAADLQVSDNGYILPAGTLGVFQEKSPTGNFYIIVWDHDFESESLNNTNARGHLWHTRAEIDTVV